MIKTIRAEFRGPDGFERAEIVMMPSGYADAETRESAVSKAQQYATHNGLVAPEFTWETNRLGECLTMRATKILEDKGTDKPVTYQAVFYYGASSLLCLYVGAESSSFPTTSITRFLASVKASAGNNAAPETQLRSTPASARPIRAFKRSWSSRRLRSDIAVMNQTSAALQRAAATGDTASQIALASRYNAGWSLGRDVLEADPVKAVKLLEKAAQTGSAEALYALYCTFSYGPPEHRDPAKSWTMLRKAAEAGNPDAQCVLGNLLAASNITEAIPWYTKAAARGQTAALRHLGEIYEIGKAAAPDKSRAAACYAAAAEFAYDPMDSSIRTCKFYWQMLQDNGFGVPKSRSDALGLYTKQAEAGKPRAQYFLGQIYYYNYGLTNEDRGMDRVAANPEQYQRWNRAAAEAGDPEAQFFLGLELAQKEETKKDGHHWLLKAARQGVTEAYYELYLKDFLPLTKVQIGSDTFYYGDKWGGVEWSAGLLAYGLEDWSNAHYYFQGAAEGEEPDACYALATMYALGQGTPRDEEQAQEFLRKASKRPSYAAITDLAIKGLASETNEFLIPFHVSRLRIAAEGGNQKAREYLAALDPELLSQSRPTWALASKPGSPDPRLKGLKGVCLDSNGTVLDDSGLVSREALKSAAELRLRAAGVNFFNSDDTQHLYPRLVMEVQTTKIEEGPIYAAHVTLKLEDQVEYRQKLTTAPIWSLDLITWAGQGKLTRHTKELLEDLVDRFANDFLKANPK